MSGFLKNLSTLFFAAIVINTTTAGVKNGFEVGNALVLSDDTGYSRDYRRNPYSGYDSSASIYFPVSSPAPSSYHAKEQVIGLVHNSKAIAFPYAELNRNSTDTIEGDLDGLAYTLIWNRDHQSGQVFDGEGNLLPAIRAFWFARYTFHPDTRVFSVTDG